MVELPPLVYPFALSDLPNHYLYHYLYLYYHLNVFFSVKSISVRSTFYRSTKHDTVHMSAIYKLLLVINHYDNHHVHIREAGECTRNQPTNQPMKLICHAMGQIRNSRKSTNNTADWISFFDAGFYSIWGDFSRRHI